MENDLTYFRRRASQERAAARHAAHPRARQAHLDMAQQFEHFIQRLAADQRKVETYAPPRAVAELEAAFPKLEQLGLTDRQCA